MISGRVVVLAVLAAAVVSAFEISTVIRTKDGRPRTMFGTLGQVNEASPLAVLDYFLHNEDVAREWGLTGAETFVHRKTQTYQNLVTTFRFDQKLNGLDVSGGEIAIHITPSTNEVHGITGNVILRAASPAEAKTVTQGVYDVLQNTHKHTNLEILTGPQLTYLIDHQDQSRLAYKIIIRSTKGSAFFGRNYGAEPEPFAVYIDAITHQLIMDVPMHHKSLFRQVFNTYNSKNLPGTLVLTESSGPTSSDTVANQAYINAGNCYYFYYNIFRRDSWNNEGAPLNSTIHYEVAYNNAFWNGEQMVYGDGDDEIFTDFANDLTVICHELSHAVTQSTSGLRYWSESGALNEGFSDIMGSSAQIYTMDPRKDAPVDNSSWVIGPNCTLVNLNPTGCPTCPPGIRYMNNPILDGQSSDYYPDRYTGYQDNRGVHLNSGIANLAYVLTVEGGYHPQRKTNVYVNAIGIQRAQQIYYTGFTQYLTTTSQFADAHAATVQAAKTLGYSTSIVTSVDNGWNAVGVATN